MFYGDKQEDLDMNAEEWSKHYSKQLEIKMDKSAGDDPVVCWLFTGRVNKAVTM